MNIKQQFKEGLITNNPVLVQLIGMCATMAITTSLFNGIGMGLSVLVILTCCNVVISLIRKVIPNDIRLAIFVLVIAGFVTIVDLLLQAYVPALSASLGVFIPLIVVNCIIIGRAEAFCQKNPVGPSFFDGIFQGLGYTLVLIAMCVIRELLGKGSFGTGIFNTIGGVIGTGNGIQIFPAEYGALVLTLPIGGFITLGCLIALMQYALRKSAEKKEAKEKRSQRRKRRRHNMSSTTSIFAIILSAVLTNNFIFSQFLGCCPFLGCSSKIDTAAGMGLAVTFVMGLASAICWLVNCLLVKLGLGFLQTIAYILVIAALVQFIEMFLKKSIPSLYSALGIYLPLITTNCAVLGVVLLNTQYSFGFVQSVVYGVFGGLGFMLAICLFASVREKLEFADYPECFEGFPICLVSAGLLALAFMGFSGMKIG